MRHSADIRMDCDSHHASAFCSFGIESLELVLGSAEKLFCLVVLQNDHRDVVQLYTVGKRNEWAAGGFDLMGLMLVEPIGGVVACGICQVIKRVYECSEQRAG